MTVDDEVYAFLDTNILLHYKPLEQIDWCATLHARSVKLVLCLPVINELDEKKNDPRLGDRARRSTKDIEEHSADSAPIRTGVSVEIYNEDLRSGDFPASLNPNSQDDRIVHLARTYSDSDATRTVCVVTEDFGMKLRCKAGGIAVRGMDASDRLDNPGDEKDRKLREAQSELLRLKNRAPRFELTILRPGESRRENGNYVFDLPPQWVDLDAQRELEKKRRAHPKHSDPRPSYAGVVFSNSLSALISPEQWQRYDQELDTYYAQYPEFVERLNTWGKFHSRTFRFCIQLENTGTSRASDIDLTLKLPKSILSLGKQTSPYWTAVPRPSEPPLPQHPKPGILDTLSAISSVRAMVRPGILDPPSVSRALDPDEPQVEVIPQPNDGWLIHVHCPKLKHGAAFRSAPFAAVFDLEVRASPFEVEYRITLDEHPAHITGKIPMVLTNASGAQGSGSADSPLAADECDGSKRS